MRIVPMIGLLAISVCVAFVVGFALHTAEAAENVVLVQDNTNHPCTRDGIVSAIDEAATTNPDQPGRVIFNCPTYIIDVLSNITIGDAGVQAVIIDGSNGDGNQIVLDAERQSSLFYVAGTGYLTLQHITLTNGVSSSVSGGAILNNGTLTIEQSALIDNEADHGGAIANAGTFEINGSYLGNNSAFTDSGAISNTGTVTMNTTTLSGNDADVIGGAVGNAGVFHIHGSYFTNNRSLNGGALFNAATATINQSTFTNNLGKAIAGAIINEGTLEIAQSTLSHNESNSGGAIYNFANLNVVSSTLDTNRAKSEGGAIWSSGQLKVAQSSFTNNHARELGGTVYLEDGDTKIVSSTIVGAAELISGALGPTITVSPTADSANIAWSTIIQPHETTASLFVAGPLTLTGVILTGEGSSCEMFGGGHLADSYTITNDDSCPLTASTSHNSLTDLGLDTATTTVIDGVSQTYFPLLTGSPAIDAGPALCDTDVIEGVDPDQLGNPRPLNGACDIGAIEINTSTVSLCVSTWTNQLSMAQESGQCPRNQTLIRLPHDAPLALCVNNWNGSTTADLQDRGCSRSEHQVTALGDQTIHICINTTSRVIRVAGTCTRTETPSRL